MAFAGVIRSAEGQDRKPRISGRVIDRASRSAVPGAQVVVLSDGTGATTDSGGNYTLTTATPGQLHILVRAIPYAPAELTVRLDAGDDVIKDFALDSADRHVQALDPVAVTAAATSYRMVDFERRRKTGRGQYMDDEQIQRSGAANVQDLTRGMRGVEIHCGGGGGCRIQMSRAPMNCQPDYVVDGRVDNMFGASTPIRDIIGLEVYTGPSDVPGEFAGRSAGCGVIVMWTRSGPPARGRP